MNLFLVVVKVNWCHAVFFLFYCSCGGFVVVWWIDGDFGDAVVFLVVKPLQRLFGTQLDHQRHQSTHIMTIVLSMILIQGPTQRGSRRPLVPA